MSASSIKEPRTKVSILLLELSVPAHRVGFLQLCTAIPLFKQDKQQSMASELYPAVAETLGYQDWRAVEHAIRDIIVAAWKHRNPKVWNKYFPGCVEAPSNKQFIATLAEYI